MPEAIGSALVMGLRADIFQYGQLDKLKTEHNIFFLYNIYILEVVESSFLAEPIQSKYKYLPTLLL